jgi:hypothetical protein
LDLLPSSAGGVSPFVFAAGLGPPLATPTSAGLSTRSPMRSPVWTTSATVPAGISVLSISNIA